MNAPARVDLEIWQGDSYPPLSWGFGPAAAPEIPVGAEFRLDIEWDASAMALAIGGDITGSLTAASPSGLTVDIATGTVTWPYTTTQSALIPRGARASYMLRCVFGGVTQTWVFGRLHVRGGGQG